MPYFVAVPWVLSCYSDLMLSQAFPPMAAQLSQKAVLPLAKIPATVSCYRSKTDDVILLQVGGGGAGSKGGGGEGTS